MLCIIKSNHRRISPIIQLDFGYARVCEKVRLFLILAIVSETMLQYHLENQPVRDN